MAGSIPDMLIQVRLETAQLKSDMANLENKFKGLGNAVTSAQNPFAKLGSTLRSGLGMLGLAVGIGTVTRAFGTAVKAASDLNETATAVDAVFGTASAQLKEYAKTTSTTMGQSQRQFLDAAKTFGIFGKAAGLAGQDNAKFSTELTVLASDLASFNNTSVDDAINSLGAALRGESEPMRKYGVLLDDNTLRAKAQEMAIYNGSGALSQQQRVLAAHALILEKTKIQQGDYLKTSDGLANSQRTLTAVIEDASAAVGEALAPAVTNLVKAMVPLVQEYAPKLAAALKKIPFAEMAKNLMSTFEWIGKNLDAIKNWIVVIGLAVGAYKLYTIGAGLAAVATGLLNKQIALSPMGLLLVAIGLTVAGLLALKDALDKSELATKKANDAYNDYVADIKKNPVAGTIQASSLGYGIGLVGLDSMQPGGKAKPKVQGDSYARYSAYTPEVLAGIAAANLKKRRLDAAALRDAKTQQAALDALSGSGSGGAGGAKESAAAKNKRVALAYLTSVNTKLAAANAKYADTVAAANADFAEKSTALQLKHTEQMTEADKEHASRVLTINADFSKRLSDIVADSMNRLRDAFKTATATDIGAMFKDMTATGKASTDDLIASLKSRLASIKTLATNAATLSGLGFSQTFIEQVVAQGPNVGSQMADALIAATPESQKELQTLFAESETVSATGMDALTKTIYEKSGLATAGLKSLYLQTQTDLAAALAEEQVTYNERVADINKTLTDGLAEANKALTESLTAASTALNSALDALDAAMTAKLLSLKGKLAGVSGTIASTRNAINTSYVAPTYNSEGFTTSGNASKAGSFMNTVGYNTSQGPAIAIYNDIKTNASASLISDTTVSSIKYGIPLSKLTA